MKTKNKSMHTALKYRSHHNGDNRCLACDNFKENMKRKCKLIHNANALGSCVAWQQTNGVGSYIKEEK